MIKSILVALGAAFFIIGVHQSFMVGIAASYWLFTLSGICFLGLQLINKKGEEEESEEDKKASPSKKSRGKKKRKK